MDPREPMDKIMKQFGSRGTFLGHQIIMLSTAGQPCDVTFFRREPAVDVTIDQSMGLALMYGAGPKKLKAMLERIRLSNGDVVSIEDIWTINPVPKGGFSDKELAAVDLAEAEQQVGPNGETLRKMVSDTYHCDTREEEDRYLRRFIAS